MREMETPRLLLRRWRETDREPFARMGLDPAVMKFFPSLLSVEQSHELFDRIQAHEEQYGFGLWAAELRETREFIGFVGLAVPPFDAAFTPCIEIGWRLAAAHWGKGLATEGARAAVGFAREDLHLEEIVSFTVPDNRASRRVMEKLGMTRDPAEDFDHPRLPPGHPKQRHVLYRLQLRRLP